MAKSFSGSGFAAAAVVRRCSGSARTAIADSVTVVPLAGMKHGSSSGVALTAVISGVRKAGWITGIDNASTGAVRPEFA